MWAAVILLFVLVFRNISGAQASEGSFTLSKVYKNSRIKEYFGENGAFLKFNIDPITQIRGSDVNLEVPFYYLLNNYSVSIEAIESHLLHYYKIPGSSISSSFSQVILNMLDSYASIPTINELLEEKIRNVLELLFHIQADHLLCDTELHTRSSLFHLIARKDCTNSNVTIPYFTIPNKLSEKLYSAPRDIRTLVIVQKTPYSRRLLTSLVTLKYYHNDTEVEVSSLESPIHIEFPISHEMSNSKVSCKYYDTNSNVWKTNGVELHSISPSSITCSASHLTQFAVFSEENEELDNQNDGETQVEEDGGDNETEKGSKSKRSTANPSDIEISDVRTLVIGLSITGTITLVVVLTAILICCSSYIMRRRQKQNRRRNVRKQSSFSLSVPSSSSASLDSSIDSSSSSLSSNPWAEADKRLLMTDDEGNLSLTPSEPRSIELDVFYPKRTMSSPYGSPNMSTPLMLITNPDGIQSSELSRTTSGNTDTSLTRRSQASIAESFLAGMNNFLYNSSSTTAPGSQSPTASLTPPLSPIMPLSSSSPVSPPRSRAFHKPRTGRPTSLFPKEGGMSPIHESPLMGGHLVSMFPVNEYESAVEDEPNIHHEMQPPMLEPPDSYFNISNNNNNNNNNNNSNNSSSVIPLAPSLSTLPPPSVSYPPPLPPSPSHHPLSPPPASGELEEVEEDINQSSSPTSFISPPLSHRSSSASSIVESIYYSASSVVSDSFRNSARAEANSEYNNNNNNNNNNNLPRVASHTFFGNDSATASPPKPPLFLSSRVHPSNEK